MFLHVSIILNIILFSNGNTFALYPIDKFYCILFSSSKKQYYSIIPSCRLCSIFYLKTTKIHLKMHQIAYPPYPLTDTRLLTFNEWRHAFSKNKEQKNRILNLRLSVLNFERSLSTFLC